MTGSYLAPTSLKLSSLTYFFKILSCPSRVRILFEISKSELCVSDIALKLEMTKSQVSHHLQILRLNRLVSYRRSGKTIFYKVIDDHVSSILEQGLTHVEEG